MNYHLPISLLDIGITIDVGNIDICISFFTDANNIVELFLH